MDPQLLHQAVEVVDRFIAGARNEAYTTNGYVQVVAALGVLKEAHPAELAAVPLEGETVDGVKMEPTGTD